MDRKILTAITIGSVVEWYDFVIYGNLSPVLSQVFFPKRDTFIGLTLTFVIFAVGFITRPFGGVILGYIADKYGRRKAFIYSILLMAISALCIAIIPTYNLIGRSAPLLLLFLRLLQGLSVGGEYPVLVSYIAEIAPVNERGKLCSYANVTTVCGVFLATLVVTLLNVSLTEHALLVWGWRIPFLISAILILSSIYLRYQLSEPLVFTQFDSTNKRFGYSFQLMIKNNKSKIIKVFGILICASVAYYSYNIFNVSYLISVFKFTYLQASGIVLLNTLLLMIFIIVFGYLSDKIGRRIVIISALIGFIILSYPFYKLFSYQQILLAFVSLFIFTILLAQYLGPLPALLAEQFETRIRCSSMAFVYNISLALFGSTAPFVNFSLINYFQNYLAPCYYLIITSIISLIAISTIKEKTPSNLI